MVGEGVDCYKTTIRESSRHQKRTHAPSPTDDPAAGLHPTTVTTGERLGNTDSRGHISVYVYPSGSSQLRLRYGRRPSHRGRYRRGAMSGYRREKSVGGCVNYYYFCLFCCGTGKHSPYRLWPTCLVMKGGSWTLLVDYQAPHHRLVLLLPSLMNNSYSHDPSISGTFPPHLYTNTR